MQKNKIEELLEKPEFSSIDREKKDILIKLSGMIKGKSSEQALAVLIKHKHMFANISFSQTEKLAIIKVLEASLTPSLSLPSTSMIYSPVIFKSFKESIFSIFNKLSNFAAFSLGQLLMLSILK